MSPPTVCVKLGGRAATNKAILSLFAEELASLRHMFEFILVHGGGAEVSRISRIFNIEPVFDHGVRMTSPEEMDIVDMVLAGLINKQLVRFLYGKGIKAVGLSGADGGLVIGESVNHDSRTGSPKSVDPGIIKTLLQENLLPVLSPVAMDNEGRALNINADDVAFALAAALPAHALLFISDIPGILLSNVVIPQMCPDEAEREIERGMIKGGMIPKVRASAEALKEGVGKVVIGGYEKEGDLGSLLEGRSGTMIYRKEVRR